MSIEDAYIELLKSNKLRQQTIIKLSKENKKLKEENAKLNEELAEANQLKDMYHTYYRAKHDDIKGIIFKQKEKLEKIKKSLHTCSIRCKKCSIQNFCQTYKIRKIIEGAEDDDRNY